MVLGLSRQHTFQLVLHSTRHAIRHRLALHHDRAIGVEVDDSTLVQDKLMPIGNLFVIDNVQVGSAQFFSPEFDVRGDPLSLACRGLGLHRLPHPLR